MNRLLLLTLLTGCSTVDYGACGEICDELTVGCGVDAYPSFTSCYEGCTYAEAYRGADVEAQNTCVQAAECDNFAILECEHAHGAL